LAWTIKIEGRPLRDLEKLDRTIQREIVHYLRHRVATAESPRVFGKQLSKSKSGLWRYRVRDYRIICKLQDDQLIVLVLKVGHRSTIYDD
jgi:mRNA interferase RelE/StbE